MLLRRKLFTIITLLLFFIINVISCAEKPTEEGVEITIVDNSNNNVEPTANENTNQQATCIDPNNPETPTNPLPPDLTDLTCSDQTIAGEWVTPTTSEGGELIKPDILLVLDEDCSGYQQGWQETKENAKDAYYLSFTWSTKAGSIFYTYTNAALCQDTRTSGARWVTWDATIGKIIPADYARDGKLLTLGTKTYIQAEEVNWENPTGKNPVQTGPSCDRNLSFGE